MARLDRAISTPVRNVFGRWHERWWVKTTAVGWSILGAVVLAVLVVVMGGWGTAGQYDQEVCSGLGYQRREFVQYDLRQRHGLDQYEAVDAVDHAIREYCPGIELR